MLQSVAPILPGVTATDFPAAAPRRRGRFRLARPDSALRTTLEREIHDGYAAHFGAEIGTFMPQLARYSHPHGGTGAIGLRAASEGPLFLERYLDAPIESIIASATGVPQSRDGIVEVGQFVVTSSRIARDLFRDLVPALVAAGHDWVCFTGTGRIRALVASAGLHGLCVGAACEAQAGDSGDRWGNYYASNPAVIIGDLSDPSGTWCQAAMTPAAVGA